MVKFGLVNAISCMFLKADEMPAGASGEAAPATEGGLQAAPGCEAPAPERVEFPALVAAGGVFRSKPDAEGNVHFDVKLVPTLPEFPRSKGADGKDIPFPWEGHKRSVHLALKKDKFDSLEGYFQYRAFEAYEEARTALKQYQDCINGVTKSATTKADKTEKTLSSLKALAAGLSPEQQAQVDMVLALLRQQTAAPIATA